MDVESVYIFRQKELIFNHAVLKLKLLIISSVQWLSLRIISSKIPKIWSLKSFRQRAQVARNKSLDQGAALPLSQLDYFIAVEVHFLAAPTDLYGRYNLQEPVEIISLKLKLIASAIQISQFTEIPSHIHKKCETFYPFQQ